MTPSRPAQVLFCYEQFDELTLLHLREFDKKKLISVETDIVVDHYKEEKFEDGAPGQPDSLPSGLRCSWWPGGGWGRAGPGSWHCWPHGLFCAAVVGVCGVFFSMCLHKTDQAKRIRSFKALIKYMHMGLRHPKSILSEV